MKKKYRYLSDCMNAKWPISPHGFIHCRLHYKLGRGHITIQRALNDRALSYTVCQNCPDFISMDDADEEVK